MVEEDDHKKIETLVQTIHLHIKHRKLKENERCKGTNLWGFHDHDRVLVEIGKAKMLRSRHLMVRPYYNWWGWLLSFFLYEQQQPQWSNFLLSKLNETSQPNQNTLTIYINMLHKYQYVDVSIRHIITPHLLPPLHILIKILFTI